MRESLVSQVVKSTGLYCLLGMTSIASASNWITQMMLMGGKINTPCAKDNPYCAAKIPAAPRPSAQFDDSQSPCDSADAPCGEAYSKQMTQSYQAGVAFIPPPYVPCAMQDGCATVRPWWQAAVVNPIQKKTIPYDPGSRPWTEKKTCGTQFIGGVYMDKPCPAGN